MAIYEKADSTAELIEVPVYATSRIATFKPQVNICFYEVNDHLGNVRGVIGIAETDTYRATMENENATLEEPPSGFFKNISTRRVSFIGAKTEHGHTTTRLAQQTRA